MILLRERYRYIIIFRRIYKRIIFFIKVKRSNWFFFSVNGDLEGEIRFSCVSGILFVILIINDLAKFRIEG